MNLEQLRRKALKALEEHGIFASLSIHVSTELEKIKANVQGKGQHYDIVISAQLDFSLYPKAIAHELAHIILHDERHTEQHKKLTEKIEKKLKED